MSVKVVGIYLTTSRLSKYPALFTSISANNNYYLQLLLLIIVSHDEQTSSPAIWQQAVAAH